MADTHLLGTLLERARQYPLDINLCYSERPIVDLTLLSPLAQKIGSLAVTDASWGDIQNTSVAVSGQLPLLHTLTIEDDGFDIGSHSPSASTSPLFGGAVNVKNFNLYIYNSSSLSRFVFPDLTSLDLYVQEGREMFPASLLLNFFEASPLLQKIIVAIPGNISYDGVPRDRVLVFPCVRDSHLSLTSCSSGWELDTHPSLPPMDGAGFSLRTVHRHCAIPEDFHHPSPQWGAIVRRYMTGIIHEVELRVVIGEEFACYINFLSSDEATFVFYFNYSIESSDDRNATLDGEMVSNLFSRASKQIRDYPLLGDVRALYIRGGGLLADDLELATNDIGKLLGSRGPLEGLNLDGCDLRPYLDPFLETPLFPNAIQPTSFPRIKEFTIVNPIQSLCDNEAYATAVVKLAESQHARGVPFERMVIPPNVPSRVVEELLRSVNTVDYDETLPGGGGDRN